MDSTFTCHDIPAVRLQDVPAGFRAQLAETFPRYVDARAELAAGDGPVIEFVRGLTVPAGARRLSPVAACVGSDYYLQDRTGSVVQIDAGQPPSGFRCRVSVECRYALFESVLEILLHTLALESGKAFFHSAAVGGDRGAVLMCGWANTGKTESLVELLKRGYAYMGDDWVILGTDGQVCSYEKAIIMYARDIALHPDLAQQHFGRSKGTFLASYCGLCRPAKSGAPVSFGRRALAFLLRLLARGVGLPTTVRVNPALLTSRTAPDTAPLKTVFFLQRGDADKVEIAPIDMNALTARMLECYAYETRLLFDPETYQQVAASRDFDLGLGIRASDVREVWQQALGGSSAELFAVRIPPYAGPGELVPRLEERIK